MMRPVVGTPTEKLSYFADRCVPTVQTVAGGIVYFLGATPPNTGLENLLDLCKVH